MNIDIYVDVDSDKYINDLAYEYFKIAGDGKNKARELFLLDRLATEMIYKRNNSFCKKAVRVADRIIKKYSNIEYAVEPYDLLNTCFMKVIKTYDPEKSDNFAQWFMDNIRYTATEMFEKYFVRRTDSESRRRRELKQKRVPNKENDGAGFDMEQVSGGESGETITIGKISAEEFIINIITLVTRFCQSGSHKKKAIYFRCFVTDYVVGICKKERLHHYISINENDTMKAADENFLDFVFIKKCRSFDEIETTPLKSYSELGLSDKAKQLEIPFELKVFAKYLNVSAAAVSQNKDAFLQFIKIDKRNPSI